MEDVSKEVVAVILVIAIVISVLGTWLVLDSATSIDSTPPAGSTLQGKANIGARIGPINLGSVDLEPDMETGNINARLIK